MNDSICVMINSCKENPDKATVGFVVATAAVGSGKNTLVFLATDGVWAGVKSAAGQIDEGAPFKPLAELVANYLAAGGRIASCAPCCKKRGIEQADLFDGVEIAGGAKLVEFLCNGAASVSF